MPRAPCVYIMTNTRHGTLCTGVTSDLARRAYEHREGLTPGFTSRYGCKRLVFYEHDERIVDAIAREKQIKGGSRAKKIALIEAMNPVEQTFTRRSHERGSASWRAQRSHPGRRPAFADGLLRLRLAMTRVIPCSPLAPPGAAMTGAPEAA